MSPSKSPQFINLWQTQAWISFRTDEAVVYASNAAALSSLERYPRDARPSQIRILPPATERSLSDRLEDGEIVGHYYEAGEQRTIPPIAWKATLKPWRHPPYLIVLVDRKEVEKFWPASTPVATKRGAKPQHDHEIIRRIHAEERASGAIKLVEAVRDRFEKLDLAKPSKATINRALAHKDDD